MLEIRNIALTSNPGTVHGKECPRHFRVLHTVYPPAVVKSISHSPAAIPIEDQLFRTESHNGCRWRFFNPAENAVSVLLQRIYFSVCIDQIHGRCILTGKIM